MMIGDYRDKVNAWVGERKNDLVVAAVIFLVGLGSFGMGRLSVVIPTKPPITVSEPAATRQGDALPMPRSKDAAPAHSSTPASRGAYVGSVAGTAYHLLWCPGALRIKEENKVWFQTKEEAERKGYKPAGNCPGL